MISRTSTYTVSFSINRLTSASEYSGSGKTKWHTSTINKILRNEKYMGNALLQKTYTTDFLTKKRIKELQDFISKQKTDITEFDEALVKKLIEKITVFADHFTVEFKSGLTIDIEA